MKRFRTISILFIIAIAVIFGCNIYYLVSLYDSIRDNVERDVISALANADVDEMWARADKANRKSKAAMEASVARGDSIEINRQGGINGIKDEDGNFVMTQTEKDGKTKVVKMPLRQDNSYTNQMVDDMSRQMHVGLDPYVDFDLVLMDSIFTERLADRHIYPNFVAVEIVKSNGEVIRKNPKIQYGGSVEDIFSLCFNPVEDLYYKAHITPLTRHIISEMSGVIVTIFLLMVTFTMAFWYLFRTVSRLRTIEEMKDDFVSNMTHELKTPIAIAYSANDALLNYDADDDPAKKLKYLMIANKQLKRLGELVETILSMSMERRKTMKLKCEEIQLRPFVKDIAAAQRMRDDKEISINVKIDDGVSVVADRIHLANVLNNLIDNAIKYSDESVEISIKASDKEIIVRDNGIGIPLKSIPYLFDKFYRVPQGNRQDVRGYGIGLYYVKGIIDKLGWDIVVKSSEGLGSVFTIKINQNEQ